MTLQRSHPSSKASRRNLAKNYAAALFMLFALAALLPLRTAHAAITYFASASNPADGNSLDQTAVAVTPPALMQAGDLVVLIGNAREAGVTMTMSATGGQTWTSQAANTTNTSQRIFWARYNGTWAANPSVAFPSGANGTTVVMHVFRPSSSANGWALDVAQTNAGFASPAAPRDVTIGGITTVTDGAVVLATWVTADNNTWQLQTAGWSNAGLAQYRNGDGNDASQSSAYKIMPTAGASGSVTNRQLTLGGDAGNASILAFKEVPPVAPTIVKSFSPGFVATNGTSTLSITLTNPNPATITGLAFNDSYPVGLVNAATPALSSSCGGTATATAGGGSVSLSGGTLAGGASCTVNVNVTSAASGSYTNSTGSVTSTNVPSASGAAATLLVGYTCFTDNFNRANGAPAGNWVVSNESGSFGNPAIVSNRLRLTDASTGASTMAALQQLFPAAGNKIVVEFDHFGYNGTGADGISVVLSDAAFSPVPGAFGGSLGYAPKQVSLGGDTTHYGFSGGWIGVALDEFGNFSANTEGRTGGAAPGQRVDSVAIRGSGTGYTGYPYHRGTATLSPGIDLAGATPAPGYRYRVIIDHTNGVNAYTSVERNTGSGYSFLISPYDAKAEAGQANVPTNWFLSFTGSTGASTNVHEIDNLQVCSINPQPLPTLNHVRILHDGSALTCAPEEITLKACADASCSTLYTGSVTVDLAAIAGATWSADPVTFSGGQTTITLSKATAGTVTLAGTVTSPVIATTAASCYIGGTQSCSLTYTLTSACFDAVEVGKSVPTPIYTKLAGTAFNLDVVSLSGSGQTATAVALVDASSGTCGTYTVLQNTSSTIPSAFAGNQRKTFAFTYNNAAPNARVRVTTASGSACSSDNFAIRPASFALTTATPLNPALNTLAAGANFNLTATARTMTPSTATAYTGTPTVIPGSINDHNATPIGAGRLAGSFPAATAGISAASFQYHDVGTITLTSNAVVDASFTAVDQVTGFVGGINHGSGGDCVLNSASNALDVTGLFYGCNIGGGALGPLGRFRVNHYALTAQFTAASCGAGTANEFTYMDHDALGLNLRVTANSTNGTVLSRYTAGYANLAPLAITGDNGGTAVPLARISQPALAAVGWTNGAYSSAAVLPEIHRFDARNAAPAVVDGPYDQFRIRVVVNDADGVGITILNGAASGQVNAADPVFSPTTRLRFGMLKIDNSYGSELLPIRVPVRTMYCAAVAGATCTQWRVNANDGCTSVSAAQGSLAYGASGTPLAFANFRISATDPNTGAGTTGNWMSANPLTLSSGTGTIVLNRPCVGSPCVRGTGSADLTLNLATMPWLQGTWTSAGAWNENPTARIKFGSPKAPYIYLRERY